MVLFRNIILSLTIILMMPWGAYLRVAAAEEAPANVVAQDQGGTMQTVVSRDRVSMSDARTEKRCRIATLPGSACAAFLILSASSHDYTRSGAFDLLRPDTGSWPPDLAASPDTGPPRSV